MFPAKWVLYTRFAVCFRLATKAGLFLNGYLFEYFPCSARVVSGHVRFCESSSLVETDCTRFYVFFIEGCGFHSVSRVFNITRECPFKPQCLCSMQKETHNVTDVRFVRQNKQLFSCAERSVFIQMCVNDEMSKTH